MHVCWCSQFRAQFDHKFYCAELQDRVIASTEGLVVFHMSRKDIDADQRLTQDLEKLTTDLSELFTGVVKPSVDILWFTWRMKLLTGRRSVFILYAYMLLGLGFLRSVTPDFGD